MEEGANAKVKRLFPTIKIRHYDPFVLLDEFFVDSKGGFPTHPHRGFEAITYMIKGSFQHKDNLGNNTTVSDGGIQRFTAGKGLTHSEMPKEDGINHGFQLWINLPKHLKNIEPDYQQVDSGDIPETSDNGIFIRTIVGEGSPVKLHTSIQYQDITLSEGKSYPIKLLSDYIGIIYLVDGLLTEGDIHLNQGEALFLPNGDSLSIEGESRFILLMGRPHNEPIKQWGPYVD